MRYFIVYGNFSGALGGKCVCLFIPLDACMGSHFLYCNFVWKPHNEVTMKAMRRLWGWLCWEDGGLMWMFRKYV